MSYRNNNNSSNRDRDYHSSSSRRDTDRDRRGNGGHDYNYDDRDKYAGDYVSICLKNLNDDLSDSQLRDAVYHEFKRFGEFNIKIVTNKTSRDPRSDRIAFVNFNEHADAKEAKRCKMNMPFEGYPLYIEPVFVNRPGARSTQVTSRRDRSRSRGTHEYSRSRTRSHSRTRRQPNTPPPATNSNTRRRRSPSNISSKRASSFDSPDRSHKKRGSLSPPMQYSSNYLRNNKHQRSSSISSTKSNTKVSSSSSTDLYDPEATRTLFVGNLDMTVDKDKLHDRFDRFGLIEDIDIKRIANKQFAYAFIKYVNLDVAAKAKKEMDGVRLARTNIRIGFAKVLPTECLWIGGLNTKARTKDLEREFGKYGPISEVDWSPGNQYAYLLFESARDADTARAGMKGKILAGEASTRLRLDFVDPERFESYRLKLRVRRERTRSRSPPRRSKSRTRSMSPIKKKESQKRLNTNDDYRELSESGKKAKKRDQTPESVRDVSPLRSTLINEGLISRELKKVKINDFGDISQSLKCNWSGIFTLKKIAFPTKFFVLAGNKHLAEQYLPNVQASLKITQRLRLDPSKIEELEAKLQELREKQSSRASSISSNSTLGDSSPNKPNPKDAQFCVMISLPNDADSVSKTNNEVKRDEAASSQEDASSTLNGTASTLQQRSLHNLITYLNQKTAAGCIPLPNDERATAMLHAFPPQSQFSTKLLRQLLPSLKNKITTGDSACTNDHLIVVLLKNN